MPSASQKGVKATTKKTTPKKAGLKAQRSKAQGAKLEGAKLQGAKLQGSKTRGAKARGPEAPPSKAPSLKLRAAKAPSLKAQVFLVAVKRRREALRVYAVLTASEAVALAIVEAASGEDVTVEPVGRLSKKLARPLRLLTGEPQPI